MVKIHLATSTFNNMRFQWKKQLILPVWPHTLNYQAINFFEFIIVFADHENIGKEPKFMVLLNTV